MSILLSICGTRMKPDKTALMGVAVIALPSGMITAAYMIEISKKKSKYEL